MGLAFVGGLDGSDKSADLHRPQGRQGDKERWRQGVRENLIIVAHNPLPLPLLVSLFSSLLSHAHCGLRVLTDLSHRKRLRQVFNQIINIFDAYREAHEIGRRRESVPQRLRNAGVRHPAGQADCRADRTEADRDVEKLCGFNHLPRKSHVAGRKTDDRAVSGGLIAVDAVAWMVGEAGIVNLDDLRATRQVFGDLSGRVVLALDA